MNKSHMVVLKQNNSDLQSHVHSLCPLLSSWAVDSQSANKIEHFLSAILPRRGDHQ